MMTRLKFPFLMLSDLIGWPRLGPMRQRLTALFFSDRVFTDRARSKRHLAQVARRSQQTEISAIFAALDELVFVFDRQGKHLKVLSTNAKLHYQPQQNRLGKTLHEIFPPATADFFLAQIHQALATQQPVQVEYPLPGNGQVVWSEARIAPLNAHTVVWAARDVTQRKQTEIALQQAEAMYRSIVENAVEGIFQTSPAGHCLAANAAVARILGYDAPQEVMATLTDIGQQLYVHAADRASMMAALHQTGAVANLETQLYRKDGSPIWVSGSARTVLDRQGKLQYIEGTITDITPRKLAEAALQDAQQRSEQLLLNVLPAAIAQRLKQTPGLIAENFESVSILFADIVGFTQLSARLQPIEVVTLLNQIFSKFDQLAEHYGLEKIKTIGDAYMVAAGLPQPCANHADAIAEMALAMQTVMPQFTTDWGEAIQLRIGIHSGAVAAGVVGTKKFTYDLWGDTVNIASRMEASGAAGQIQVTAATYQALKERYELVERGSIAIKGKGAMTTYWLSDSRNQQLAPVSMSASRA